jgi:hypothetical protein
MIKVDVRHTLNQAFLDMKALAEDLQDKATVRALNKTADQAKVQASRQIRDTGYNLKAGDIKAAMRVMRASPDNLVASVVTSGRPIPLIKYGARQVKAGVSVNVLKGRKVIQHAFIATMPNGHTGVYVREAGGKHVKVRSSWHQLPIRELFGPSIPEAIVNSAVQEALRAFIVDKFPSILQQETRYWQTRSTRP